MLRTAWGSGSPLLHRKQNTKRNPTGKYLLRIVLSTGLLQSKHKWVLQPVNLQGVTLFLGHFLLVPSLPTSVASQYFSEILFQPLASTYHAEFLQDHCYFQANYTGEGKKKKSTAFYITKWLISLTASHPAATREARLNWFSNQPQGAREHWSSASGEHRLGFRATFGLLKLHTRSQVFGSRSPVTFHKSLCLPPTADRVSMLFTEVKNGETTYDWDGGHNAESIHLL